MVLRVGVDGQIKNLNAPEYGTAATRVIFSLLVDESFAFVERCWALMLRWSELPGDVCCGKVRRLELRLYDKIGTYDN